jgi:regulator of protease activity HflC (stomatin/prohibitin superfamily)
VPYLFNVENPEAFLTNQARDVVRRVCGKFPFRANEPGQPSLSEDSNALSKHMTAMLNRRVQVAGFRVERMAIMEISYTPEMAQALLQVQ